MELLDYRSSTDEAEMAEICLRKLRTFLDNHLPDYLTPQRYRSPTAQRALLAAQQLGRLSSNALIGSCSPQPSVRCWCGRSNVGTRMSESYG